MPPDMVHPASRRAVLARLALAAASLAACDQPAALGGGRASFRAIDISGADYGRDFRLTDVDAPSAAWPTGAVSRCCCISASCSAPTSAPRR